MSITPKEALDNCWVRARAQAYSIMILLTSIPATSMSGRAKATSHTQPPGPQATSSTLASGGRSGTPVSGPPIAFVTTRSRSMRRAISVGDSASKMYVLFSVVVASSGMGTSLVVYCCSDAGSCFHLLNVLSFIVLRDLIYRGHCNGNTEYACLFQLLPSKSQAYFDMSRKAPWTASRCQISEATPSGQKAALAIQEVLGERYLPMSRESSEGGLP